MVNTVLEKEGEGGSDQSESQTENRRTSLIQNQSRLTRIIVPDASTSGANDKNTDPSSETPVKDASESNSVKTASVNEEPKPGNETSQEQSNPQTPSKGKPKSNVGRLSFIYKKSNLSDCDPGTVIRDQ